jgi:hypothetical protein
MNPEAILQAIQADPRYQRNVDWGRPRPGHPEGSVRAHIAELEHNLDQLSTRLHPGERDRLQILIHTHDTLKADAVETAPIVAPNSHASLARAFLAEFTDDADLLAMVQFHDEPFALWRQLRSKGRFSPERMAALREAIQDWDLFNAFLIIDGCTEGKSRESLRWWFAESAATRPSRFSELDLLD